MTVSELIQALEMMPKYAEVVFYDHDCNELDIGDPVEVRTEDGEVKVRL